MVSLADQIPQSLQLIRRPRRDEREEDLPELRTDDGHVLAIVEQIPADSLH